MSSILDALRKLDEQKAVRRQPQVDVTRGVVRNSAAPTGLRVRPWQLAVALVLVALSSTVITFWATRHPVTPPVTPPQPVAATPVVPTAAPTPVLPQSVAAQPAAQPQTKPQQPVARPSAPVSVSGNSLPAGKPRPVPLPVPEQRGGLTPATTPAPPQVKPAITAPLEAPVVEPPRPVAAPSAPALKVTGIGWQKDAASRYAVINGTAVSEGGSVEGARVEEIMPDRVRLRTGERVIELGLGK